MTYPTGARRRWLRHVTIPVPTFRGWIAVAAASVLLAVLFVRSVHPFLAVSEPLGSGVLVVEGWLPDSAVTDILAIHAAGDYTAIVATGGPISHGSYLRDFGSFAELAARTLQAAHVGIDTVFAVPAPHVAKDRTFASAQALREWMTRQSTVIDRIDVVTAGVHSRRSRLLLSMGLGGDIDVGVIALEPDAYDAGGWWRTSAGVRTVIGEVIAYTYAKALFWP